MSGYDLKTTPAFPVCSTCNDTHAMTLHRANGDEQTVMCTHCPVPCRLCRLGRELRVCVTYILRGPDFGLPEKFCVMSVVKT